VRILLIRREPQLGEAIQEGLNAVQHIVTLVHTGEEGFYRVQTESLDLGLY
jgi:DNA-binding response OmpR family regulator